MSSLTFTLNLLLATAALASTTREWVKYKLQHEKIYSEEEDAARKKIWMKNVAMVEKHNSKKHNYSMVINKFSDWTKEEFNNLLGYRPRGERSNGKIFKNVKTPNKVDYRQKDLVTPVKDQGDYDSSWAFSAIEGVWAKNKSELVSLSAQQLVDCVTKSSGCRWVGAAWDHVVQVGGIQSDESYLYTAQDGNCQEDSSKFVAQISGIENINPDEVQIESALVDLGHPISISLRVDETWTHYEGGIYDGNQEWDGPFNYAVLLVGYDKSGPEPFWIVKNSWGAEWGENGYIRMKMGVNSCGLKEMPCYPIKDTASSTSTTTSSTPTISSSTSTTTSSTPTISSSTSTTTSSTPTIYSSTSTTTTSTPTVSSSTSTNTSSTPTISSSTSTTTVSTSAVTSTWTPTANITATTPTTTTTPNKTTT